MKFWLSLTLYFLVGNCVVLFIQTSKGRLGKGVQSFFTAGSPTNDAVSPTTTKPVVTENVAIYTQVPYTTISETTTDINDQTTTTKLKDTNKRSQIIGGTLGTTIILCAIICLSVIFIMVISYFRGYYQKSPQTCDVNLLLRDFTVACSSAVDDYLEKHTEYTVSDSLRLHELGSREQKRWYSGVCGTEESENKKLLTVSPVSQSCPLKLHKYQNGLNDLLQAIKEHPYLHPTEQVEFLVDHQLLVMVQPFVHSGSLKDFIYETSPLTAWSEKYAKRSRGLPNETLAVYGRQILEAMKFLYSQGFPTLGHVQTGNIFVVNDVCQLGGYENTLLGYESRLFGLCMDYLQHFDIILFGHVMFEMAAGYELTQTCPGQADYMAVDARVKPVLEYIFEEGFTHDITEISTHEFFCNNVSLPELCDFDSDKIHLSDSMNTVLEKVRKNKPRVQLKASKTTAEMTLPKWKLKKTDGIGGSKSEYKAHVDTIESKMKIGPIFSRKRNLNEDTNQLISRTDDEESNV